MAGRQTLEAVLLDFDGTIFDLALDLTDFKNHWKTAGSSVSMILNTLKGQELESATRQLEAIELNGVVQGKPAVYAADAIAQLTARYKLGVVSGTGRAAIEAGLKQITQLQIPIISRESTSAQKPSPQPVQLALQQLGVTRAILVGDSERDVQAAKAAGIECVVIANPKLEYAPLGAHYYLDTLRELPALMERLT
jgi:HAD superfamily hydrolase (TIGR01549 family)